MSARPERGTVTLWLLGLCLLLFALGGISLDLWRAFSERRALAAAADSAALAGASAIDEARYRSTGALVLDPAAAEARARADLAEQADTRALRGAVVRADGDAVEVTLDGSVALTLLGVLERGTFGVQVHAVAVPRRSP